MGKLEVKETTNKVVTEVTFDELPINSLFLWKDPTYNHGVKLKHKQDAVIIFPYIGSNSNRVQVSSVDDALREKPVIPCTGCLTWRKE